MNSDVQGWERVAESIDELVEEIVVVFLGPRGMPEVAEARKAVRALLEGRSRKEALQIARRP